MKRILLVILIFVSGYCHSQTINNFELMDVKSGKSIALNDFKDKQVIVIIFTSNVCPYSVYYEGRITQLIADFKNVQFLLINSHKEDKESKEEMVNKIEAWGLNVPYLADKDQKIQNAFKARKSPEAYILKPNVNGFNIFYHGAIDNNPQVATDVKSSFLRDNINNVLQGKLAVGGGRPIGCMIK